MKSKTTVCKINNAQFLNLAADQILGVKAEKYEKLFNQPYRANFINKQILNQYFGSASEYSLI